MGSSEIDRLARRIIELEQKFEAATRSSQLGFSSVYAPGVGDISVVDGVVDGSDASSGLYELEAGTEESDRNLGDSIGSVVEVPNWIDNSGNSTAWDASQFAVDLSKHLESELGESMVELQRALAESAAALAEAGLARSEAAVAVDQAQQAVNSAIAAVAEAQTAAQAAAAADSKAESAAVDAANAQDTANSVQGIANDAKADAEQAINDALAAANAAASAEGKADTAQNTANSKGKTLIQDSTPGEADRLPQNLWIDTTGDANTPKKWSGSAWVAVTDKAATDAAAAAVTAKNAADTAQARADDAFTNAAAAAAAAGAAQASANGKNTVWYLATEPAGTLHRQGDTWFNTSKDGQIARWSGTAWEVQKLGTHAFADLSVTNAIIANLDAAKISTGFLAAARIAANSISVSKLLVGSFTNLAQDPSFEANSTEAWTLQGGTTNDTINPRTGSRVLKVPTTTNQFMGASQTTRAQVAEGESYRVSAWVRLDTGTSVGSGISLRFRHSVSETGALTTAPDVASTPVGTGTSYVRISGVWEVPVGAKFAVLDIISRDVVAGKTYRVDDVELSRMSTGELIVDGSVTTDKLAANSVVAEKIAALAITAAHLAADSVAAVNIAANAVTTEKLAAGSVTTDILDALAVTAEKLAVGSVIAEKIAAGAIVAEHIAVGALDAITIRGAQIYGGYIEAPTIASSDKLGSGANVLNDPGLTSTVNTSWVASGHLGDSASRTQVDNIKWPWETVWTQQQWSYPGGYTYDYMRNWAVITATATLSPGTQRSTGTIVFPNLSFFNQAVRSINAPYTYVNKSWMQMAPYQGGGTADPSFYNCPVVPAAVAGTARTTYLTNSAVIPVVLGERWNAKIGFTKVSVESVSEVTSAAIEIINSTTSAVLKSIPISIIDLMAGNCNAWWDSTFTGNIKFRVKFTYTSGGSMNFVRRPAVGNYATQSVNGVEIAGKWTAIANSALPYGSSPTTVSVGAFQNLPPQLSKNAFKVAITSALFAKVQPVKGWRLTEDSGFELFNSLGAKTGQLDGQDNFLSGRFASADTGARVEMKNQSLSSFDAGNVGLGKLDVINNRLRFLEPSGRPKDTAIAAYFTATANIPIASSAGNTGTFYVDSGNPVQSAYASGVNSPYTPGAHGITIDEDGVYLFVIRAGVPVATSGRSFIEINAGSVYGVQEFPVGSYNFMVVCSGQVLAGTFVRCTVYQNTGATRSITSRLWCLRLGDIT